jgi:hypothetical protein
VLTNRAMKTDPVAAAAAVDGDNIDASANVEANAIPSVMLCFFVFCILYWCVFDVVFVLDS